MNVIIEFKTSYKEIMSNFLTCSGKLNDISDYVNENDTLTENGTRLLLRNLVETENPHKQIRKQIQLRLILEKIPRAVIYEFDRHPVGCAKADVEFFSVDNIPTIQSTRYSLHSIANDDRIPELSFLHKCENLYTYFVDRPDNEFLFIRSIVSEYFFIPDTFRRDYDSRLWIAQRLIELINIKGYKLLGMSNDDLKKYINEYMYANTITCSTNVEWLYNFLQQRLDKDKVFPLMYQLAKKIYNSIPEKYKLLFKIYKYQKPVLLKPIKKSIVQLINNVETDKINKIILLDNLKELQRFLDKNLIEKIEL